MIGIKVPPVTELDVFDVSDFSQTSIQQGEIVMTKRTLVAATMAIPSSSAILLA
jgi:hypothetical protein